MGLAAVAAVGAFGAELRSAERARRALEARALGEQRLAALELTPALLLERLPDSLAHGRFDRPFESYAWQATAARSRTDDFLYDLSVRVSWDAGNFALATRVYRPPPPAVAR